MISQPHVQLNRINRSEWVWFGHSNGMHKKYGFGQLHLTKSTLFTPFDLIVLRSNTHKALCTLYIKCKYFGNFGWWIFRRFTPIYTAVRSFCIHQRLWMKPKFVTKSQLFCGHWRSSCYRCRRHHHHHHQSIIQFVSFHLWWAVPHLILNSENFAFVENDTQRIMLMCYVPAPINKHWNFNRIDCNCIYSSQCDQPSDSECKVFAIITLCESYCSAHMALLLSAVPLISLYVTLNFHSQFVRTAYSLQ